MKPTIITNQQLLDQELLKLQRLLKDETHPQKRHRLVQRINGLLDDRLGMMKKERFALEP